MATSRKGVFSIGVPAACLRGKNAWLAATAIGLVSLSGTTMPADAFGLFGDSYSRSYGYGGYGGYGSYGGSASVASRYSGHRRSNDSGTSTGPAGTSKDQAKKETPKPPAGP
ncbi:MAG: hypothetical protein JO134_10230, partial [Xanthobacteraceae bacterium]|nr:hypothetical protein [Xanthobacteraceae bacterium]